MSTFNMPLSWILQGSYDMRSSHLEMFPLASMLQSSPQACGASDCTGQHPTQHWGAQWAPPPQKCRNSLKCILSSAFLRGGGEMHTLSSDRQDLHVFGLSFVGTRYLRAGLISPDRGFLRSILQFIPLLLQVLTIQKSRRMMVWITCLNPIHHYSSWGRECFKRNKSLQFLILSTHTS